MNVYYLLTLFISLASAVLYAEEYKKFLILIPSYNNAQWYKKNLDSVCSQDYPSYRVIYINDCSTDGTGFLVDLYIQENNLHNKVTCIHNLVRKGAMANWYTHIHAADDDEIIVSVDGDDWLADNTVLSTLNTVYQDPHVWLTYGQFLSNSNCLLGGGFPYPEDALIDNTYRKHDFRATHLRTFYAWLFKRIKKEDLQYENEFFPMTCDLAIMNPMLEMCAGRLKCIDKILYIYNDCNPLNDHRIDSTIQQKYAHYICNLPPYAPL